jgi:hypothetical protein
MHRISFALFAALTLVGLAADALYSFSLGALAYRPLGEVWYTLHSASLNGAQAGVQRYISPWLWDPAIVTVLQAPAWIIPLGITIGLAILKRR